MNKQLIGIKKTEDYSLYTSPFVIDNKVSIIEAADRAYSDFKKIFNKSDSTWNYNRYNIFSLTTGNSYYHVLYQQIVAAIKDRVGDGDPLWMQCWLNYHRQDEVLDWHAHDYRYTLHGYLSIDPMHTVTEFRGFTIENKVGNLYVGRSGDDMEHRVVVKTPYTGNRITLAFDVVKNIGKMTDSLSFIPIL